MRLSEELARILPGRRHTPRRPAEQAPREIVPSADRTKAQRLDAARQRLRDQIPPKSDA